jgi:hypothetical protein
VTAVRSIRLRPARRPRAGTVAGLLLGAVLALLVAPRVGGGSGGDVTVRRSVDTELDLAAYAAALEPLAEQGGQIVVDGMRPGVADIAQGAYPDGVLIRMASGWLASMREVRGAVTELSVGPEIAAVAARIERAFAAYVSTAETLLRAARAHGEERDLLVDVAAARGRAADRLYDEATAELAGLDRSLPTSTRPERP